MSHQSKNPGISGVLSFLLPGLGQLYNGFFLSALLWLLITGVSWIGTAGTLGVVVHLLSAYFAYKGALRVNVERRTEIPAMTV